MKKITIIINKSPRDEAIWQRIEQEKERTGLPTSTIVKQMLENNFKLQQIRNNDTKYIDHNITFEKLQNIEKKENSS